jgi:hypothetical protein
MFKVHKVNTAPAGTGIKSWQVSIQVSESGSRDGAKNVIGNSCVSNDEFDALKKRIIRDIQKLRFPN